MALTRDDYLKQYNDYATQTAQTDYDKKILALTQARDQSLTANALGRTGIENTYATGANRLNENTASQLPQYQTQRNTVSAEAAMAGQRLREMLADNGMRGGLGRTQAMQVENNRQQRMGQVDQSQNEFLNTQANRLSELEAGRNADLAAIEAQNRLINQQFNESQLGLQNQRQAAIQNAALQAPILYQDYSAQNQTLDTSRLGALLQYLVGQAAYSGAVGMPTDLAASIADILARYRTNA